MCDARGGGPRVGADIDNRSIGLTISITTKGIATAMDQPFTIGMTPRSTTRAAAGRAWATDDARGGGPRVGVQIGIRRIGLTLIHFVGFPG